MGVRAIGKEKKKKTMQAAVKITPHLIEEKEPLWYQVP
jgi:hypothetical protein